MVVCGTHHRCFEQSVVAINSHKGFNDEYYEAEVVFTILACCMKQYASIGNQAPVVVLTRTIDACKRLFVEQHAEAMLVSNLAHKAHQEHVVVYSQVALLINRSKLKLVWCNLVVASFARNTKFKSLYLKVFHESLHTLRDSSEVVVVHLLVFC